MVSANQFGSEGFKVDHIDVNDFNPSAFLPVGKEKRGGVGGKGSKSNNFKEAKNANRRRNEKREREETKVQN